MFILFTNCKNENLVEIYLPKDRIESNYGIELSNINFIDTNRIKSINQIFNENTKYLKFDTIKNDLIYSGTFNIENKDLNNEPLIFHHEIIDFDTNNCSFKLEKSAIKKIKELQPFNKKGFGQQFILSINKRPLLQGYFISDFHKYPVENNYAFITNEGIRLFTSKHECIDDSLKLNIKKLIKTAANTSLAK